MDKDAIIQAARMRSVSRKNPLLEDLPEWVEEFRPWQVDAVKDIVKGFEDGDVVVLDAPTGSGKTLIAECVRRMVSRRAIYSCTTIALQEQFHGDYPYGAVVKGRANYPTVDGGARFTAADCTFSQDYPKCRLCPSKDKCPYEKAKLAAITSDLAVLNTSYLLTEGNGPGRFKGRGLVIVDEADLLEAELMRWVSIDMGERTVREYGIKPPAKVTVASAWVEWKNDVLPVLREYRSKLDRERDDRKHKRVSGYISKIAKADFAEGWVYTGKDNYISFKPVKVDDVANDSLWPLGQKFLLMSATIISAGVMLEELGWRKNYSVVNVDSTFDADNRKVHIRPAGDMSRKKGEKAEVLSAIVELTQFHKDDNILIHTVSYEVARYIAEGLAEWELPASRPVFTYSSSGEKEAAIQGFRTSTRGVLVAPSLDRGIDLPDDLCRVQIIAKVPYPYLGDRQVNARLHSQGGRVWYNVQTVRSIVQMTGRGVRHKNDFAVTYILDGQFAGLWNQARGLFPRWWTDSLNWRR